jgi:hypothetical protein
MPRAGAGLSRTCPSLKVVSNSLVTAVNIHASTGSRLVAVVVAVLLSGAPRVVTARSAEGGQSCKCHHGATRCQCCSRMHLGATKQSPPCHRGTEDDRPRPSSLGACIASGCGVPEAHVQQRTGTDVFMLSAAVQVSALSESDTVFVPRCEEHERAQEPDTPPPRLG